MCRTDKSRSQSRGGFTVTELLVAVTLMSVVIYALYSVFNQTTRALRANEAQVDTTERGRGVLELVARDMETARVGNVFEVTNFFARLAPGASNVQSDREPNAYVSDRTNLMHTVYYLSQKERGWRGVGYGLYLRNPTNETQMEATKWGMGSLYRYETVTNYGLPTTNLFQNFEAMMPDASVVTNFPTANFSHIADGVVHFRVTSYDTQGHLMAAHTTNRDPAYVILRRNAGGGRIDATSSPASTNVNNATAILQALSDADNVEPIESMVSFRSNAAPAYIEIELGVLDPEAVKTFDLFLRDAKETGQAPTRAQDFLNKRIGKVQIFRKRIPLRTVSP